MSEGNTTNGNNPMGEALTAEKLQAMRDEIRRLSRPRDDVFADLLRPFPRKPLGLNVYDAPPPPPRLQVADIKLGDGTALLPPAFRARVNADLIEWFGFRDDPFADKVYFLGNYGIVCHPKYRAIINMLGN